MCSPHSLTSIHLTRYFGFSCKFCTMSMCCFFNIRDECQYCQNPAGAQSSINQWVEQKSNNKIKQLLPPGAVTADTKIVLANVVHFRSRWQTAFEQTDEEDFRLERGRTVKVNMMSGEMDAGYASDLGGGAKVAELPFEDGEHSMVVVTKGTVVKGGSAGDVSPLIRTIINSEDRRLAEAISDPSRLPRRKIRVKMPKYDRKF